MRRHDRKTTRQDIDFQSIELIHEIQDMAHDRRTSFSELVRETLKLKVEEWKNAKSKKV
jgi:hypothetical protein